MAHCSHAHQDHQRTRTHTHTHTHTSCQRWEPRGTQSRPAVEPDHRRTLKEVCSETASIRPSAMDDFEYSVQISEQDWECFFKDCEECSLLPPTLAGMDDSGTSDLDDLGSAQQSRGRVEPDLGATFLEDLQPSDGSPDREECSPLPNYLSKYTVGVSENILSGSEEDVHLESVNRFFERLRSFSETGQLVEPGMMAAGRTVEAEQREMCSDGPLANLAALPANIFQSNTQPDVSEPAAVTDASDCTTTGKDMGDDFKMAPGHTHGESQDEGEKYVFPDTELVIREEEWSTTTNHQPRKTRDEEDLSSSFCPNLPPTPGNLPQTSQTWVDESMDDLRLGGDFAGQTDLERSPPLHEKPPFNPDVNPCDDEAEKSTCVGSSQLDVTRVASQVLTPAGSNKKKKRRKKRASMEPVEAGCRYERQFLANRSDSDEETRASREAETNPQAKLSGDGCDVVMIKHNQPLQSLAGDKELSTLSNHGGNAVTDLQPRSSRSTLQASVEFKECAGLSVVSCATCEGGEPGSTGNPATSQKEHEPQVKDIDRESMNVEDGIARDLTPPARDSLSDVMDCTMRLDKQGKYVGGEMHHKFTRPTSDFREIPKEERSDLKPSLSDKLSFPHKSSEAKHSDPNKGISQTHNREDPYQTESLETGTDSLSELPRFLKDDPERRLKCPIFEENSLTSSAFEGHHNVVGVSNITASTVLAVSNHTDESRTSSKRPDTPINSSGTRPIEITDRYKSRDTCENIPELGACRSSVPAENEVTTATEEQVTGNASDPRRTHVHAMSSFWKDMEQLTINDILRLRGISDVQPARGTGEPVEGAESGYFNQRRDLNPQPSCEAFNISGFHEDSNAISDPDAGDFSPSVLRERKRNSAGPRTERSSDDVTLVRDLPQQIVPGSPQKYYVKKMYKNRSLQNLPALKSKPLEQSLKSQVLPTIHAEEGEDNTKFLSKENALRRDSGLDSLPPSSFSQPVTTRSYSVSIADIFRYFFPRSSSEPCQADTDNLAASSASGNSVAETYDDFFSDFVVDNFFYPLLVEGHDKNETVPIFSCSRSASRRKLQFPDAYDHFFSSPSSDNSSVESDEDDNESRAPIRIVSRFTLQDGEIQRVSTMSDIYENFFSDWDQCGNVFWKNGLSLRNVRFLGSTYQRPTSNSFFNQNRETIPPIRVLDNQDQPFLDPLLYNFSDRLVRQLAENPSSQDHLQMAAADPRLDAPLLTLRQTDMCLVCIAFASWVLKSANPLVGDAWKAVLLANVSALSAIRYLRRHARGEEPERGGRTHARGEEPERQNPPL